MTSPTTWLFKGDCLLVTKPEDREVLRVAITDYETWLRQTDRTIDSADVPGAHGIYCEQHGGAVPFYFLTFGGVEWPLSKYPFTNQTGDFQSYPCQAIKLHRPTSDVTATYLLELSMWLCGNETGMVPEVRRFYDIIDDVVSRATTGHYLITYHT